ncbi:hypothetical protein I6F35_00775 [Bradyrhizobium sp. BRP22]|uniref:hypothetical protein n=1 Tax=Bradyrhizobium sp. BRP22 TaxID=2793821 RepID=UPI001CD4D0B6|nr:hypothetical protein [Bradyrhizobium sp. BRP22]MCA1451744.1 hypothetical protein [Bradyrhizobium sp. BRP22]
MTALEVTVPVRRVEQALPAIVEAVGAGMRIVGTVGSAAAGPTMPRVGDTPGVGTGAAELTPRLLISDESRGMPVRATPPDVVGEVDDGVDDAVTLVEPEPHIPDVPDVSMMPDAVAMPELSSVPEVVDTPDVADIADDMPGVSAVLPAIAAVAGAFAPTAIPAPSNVADDPNICAGAVPTVEQTVPLLGMAIVPVAGAASGLRPGDESSVAPSGIPVGEIGEPVALPSGEVASSVGVGVAMPVTCATAAWPANNAGRRAVAEITVHRLIMTLHSVNEAPASTAPDSEPAEFSDGLKRRRVRPRIH